MNDLLPGDRVRVRFSSTCGEWAGKTGTITYASDAHGESRVYDVSFGGLPSTSFTATEVEEVARSGAAPGTRLAPVSTTRR